MVLVIGIEDDEVVILVLGRDVLPPGLEARDIGDDVAVEAAVVVGLDHGVRALFGDIVDLRGEVAQVEGIEGSIEFVGSEALHEEVKADEVHAFVNEGLEEWVSRVGWIGVSVGRANCIQWLFQLFHSRLFNPLFGIPSKFVVIFPDVHHSLLLSPHTSFQDMKHSILTSSVL